MALVLDDDLKMGRIYGPDQIKQILTCGRISSTGKRTFSLTPGKIGKGVKRAALRSRLDYDKRDGEHEGRVDELESVGGRSNGEMETILVAAQAAQSRSDGIAAMTFKLELPSEMNAQQRQQVMAAIEGQFEQQGHPVHWAVHSHNEQKKYQPHGHLTVTKRPVRLVGTHWAGEGGGNRWDESRPDSFGQFPAIYKWITCRFQSGFADGGPHGGRA